MVLSNTLRGAIVGWNKTLAAEVAAEGITCNILAPGAIETDRLRETAGFEAKRTGRERRGGAGEACRHHPRRPARPARGVRRRRRLPRLGPRRPTSPAASSASTAG
ncbi:MAG: SDR family oxidoreductase [Acetobacteraceae bacterium]|nr:SDR family oxidoreductase [Acetobacteraceae bacterium]